MPLYSLPSSTTDAVRWGEPVSFRYMSFAGVQAERQEAVLLGMTTVAKKSTRKGTFVGDSPVVPPLITVVIIFILFYAFVPRFGTVRTVSGIASADAVNAIAVIGVTLLMIAGEFDLSIGAAMAMGGYVFARIIVIEGGSPVVAVGAALFVTAIMGLINGLLTVGPGIPSFIVTLGTRSIYRAALWVISGGAMIQASERLAVYDFLNGRLDIVDHLVTGSSLTTSIVWAIALGIIFQLLLTRTRFGNHVFAAGGSPEAALVQGVNVRLVKLLCFTLCGALAGFAGVLLFSQFTTVFVMTAAEVELTAIAAAVVGGTLLTGGVGSIAGGVIGIFIIGTLRSGVILSGFPSDKFPAIVGVTIVCASILNRWIRSRS